MLYVYVNTSLDFLNRTVHEINMCRVSLCKSPFVLLIFGSLDTRTHACTYTPHIHTHIRTCMHAHTD